jgi:serine protease
MQRSAPLRHLALNLLTLVLAAPAVAIAKQPVQPAAADPVTRVVVTYRDGAAAVEAAAVARAGALKMGVEPLAWVRNLDEGTQVFRLQRPLSQADFGALAAQMRAQNSRILTVERDIVVRTLLIPNDPDFAPRQWHFKEPTTPDGNRGGSNFVPAWDVNRGAGVLVAVVDEGSIDHPDLTANLIGGYDFISDPQTARDGDGRDANAAEEGSWGEIGECGSGSDKNTTLQPSAWHGAHVAGTVAAVTGNGLGLAGGAFEAKVVPVRALGRCGIGFLSDIADAIRWSAGGTVPGVPANPNPARVVNLSLGGVGSCPAYMQRAVNDARARGAVVVAATGNDGSPSTIGTPANCAGVMAVTAHNFQGDNADYANVGAGTSISAPGGGACTEPDGPSFTCLTPSGAAANFGVWSLGLWGQRGPTSTNASGNSSGPNIFGNIGTSMATPHVSAAAALLISADGSLSESRVRAALAASARSFPAGTYCANQTDGRCGAGMLDAAAALSLLSLPRQPTAAALLPLSRSATVGSTVTVFATLINGGSATARSCAIAVDTPAFVGDFWFQTTNPATNALTGKRNAPVDIAPGAAQSFVLGFTPTGTLSPTDLPLRFDCLNAAAVPARTGLNTLLLSASSSPVPDVIALSATTGNDGIVSLPGTTGSGAFAVATSNVGAAGTITVSADTGGASLPVDLLVCQTNPGTGACLATPQSSVTLSVGAGATPTFAVFATGRGAIAFAPDVNRVFVRFRDSGTQVRGATSVAIRTQ